MDSSINGIDSNTLRDGGIDMALSVFSEEMLRHFEIASLGENVNAFGAAYSSIICGAILLKAARVCGKRR